MAIERRHNGLSILTSVSMPQGSIIRRLNPEQMQQAMSKGRGEPQAVPDAMLGNVKKKLHDKEKPGP